MQRRELAKAAIFGTAGLFGSHAVSAKPGLKWDEEADVVVVGFGGAGASAAIEAHDGGAKVVLLEKTAEGGGNTSVSHGGVMIPKNPDDAYEYLMATFEYAKSAVDKDLVRVFVNEIMSQGDFLTGLAEGAKIGRYGGAGFPSLPHADVIDKYTFMYAGRSAGPALFAIYRHAVLDVRKIPVYFNTAAKRLIVDNGRVVGVEAEEKGVAKRFHGRKGVILACGGFEYAPDLLQNYVKGANIRALGCPANTGDGIRMAQSVGAQLWHMTCSSCKLGTVVPGKQAMADCAKIASGIWVDQEGKRFVDENRIDAHASLYAVDVFDPIAHRYPRIPAFMIFDEKSRMAGPVAGTTGGWLAHRENYNWSKDNTVELEAGIIKKADTIEKLAEIIGINPEGLKATVARWNNDVKAGQDAEFGRPIQNAAGRVVSAPIDQGPFYSIELYPALLNTMGGPRRDVQGHILNGHGEAIPGLYGAGELGSIWGHIYQGACNNAECVVFGRIAGRSAAKGE